MASDVTQGEESPVVMTVSNRPCESNVVELADYQRDHFWDFIDAAIVLGEKTKLTFAFGGDQLGVVSFLDATVFHEQLSECATGNVHMTPDEIAHHRMRSRENFSDSPGTMLDLLRIAFSVDGAHSGFVGPKGVVVDTYMRGGGSKKISGSTPK